MLFAVCLAAGALPQWYTDHRVHAHTRLPVNSFCKEQSLPQPCGNWSTRVPGRSPGSSISGPIHGVKSWDACQALCCAANASACLAVIYDATHATCNLLDRTYNEAFEPATDVFVANSGRSSPPPGNGSWACEPIFEHAGAAFASLGVPAYVRHTHTADEGVWWPSSSDPRESWHPLVQATNRSLPQEFLAEAARAGTKAIFYHYMKTNKYVARSNLAPSHRCIACRMSLQVLLDGAPRVGAAVAEWQRHPVGARRRPDAVLGRVDGHVHRAGGAARALRRRRLLL